MVQEVYFLDHPQTRTTPWFAGTENRQGGLEMLVLGRNLNETIVIDGKIFIKIVRGKLGNGLKVAIEAPRDVSIVRGELFPGIEKMEAKWARALGPDN